MSMHSSTVAPIPYRRNGAEWADHFSDLPGLAFLDTYGGEGSPHAGWDLISALPSKTFAIEDYQHDVLAWLRAIEESLNTSHCRQPSGNLPFGTGAIGYLDYDSAARLHGIARKAPRPARAGIYSACLVQHHDTQSAWLVTEKNCPQHIKRIFSERTRAAPVRGKKLARPAIESAFQSDVTEERYLSDVRQIQEYLRAGDCYQVNYAHRFHAAYFGDYWSLYCQLRDVLAGRFSAFLMPEASHAVLSFSPEQFVSTDAGRVITQPIKGTAPRSSDPIRDHATATELLRSVKDRAENVMITDLLRNDLGRFCTPGSIVTSELCKLHSFKNVHHLVSTVEGCLRPEVTPAALLAGVTPGGSITGAPKRRAVEVIAELESAPRGVYCGNVFTLTAGGSLQSSIAIRTVEAIDKALFCWGGGGITVESDPVAEYQETLDKIGSLLSAFDVSYPSGY